MAHLHEARGDAQEEDTLLLVLGVELADNHVQSRFGRSIDGHIVDFVIVDEVEIGMPAANGDGLLDLALLDQRQEEVEEVDVADDVHLKGLGCNCLQLLGLFASVQVE